MECEPLESPEIFCFKSKILAICDFEFVCFTLFGGVSGPWCHLLPCQGGWIGPAKEGWRGNGDEWPTFRVSDFLYFLSYLGRKMAGITTQSFSILIRN